MKINYKNNINKSFICNVRYIKITLLLFLILISLNSCGSDRKNESKRTKNANISSTPITQKAALSKPLINVYIENSASMDGFVNGTTEFEQAVYNYLADIKISGISDALNLYYINSSSIPFASKPNAEVIADFIDKLEPSTFKSRGGDRGRSDIANVLKTILKETSKNEIAILVTDGIFSPGKGKDASQYLVSQQIGIKSAMADYLDSNPNTAVVIYQLYSMFNGTYFNKFDERSSIKEARPYYIWIIGQVNNVAILKKAVPESKFNGSGVKSMFSIVPGNQKIDFAIKQNSGEFEKSRSNPKSEIINLSKDNITGKVSFSINANFTNLLLDDRYLTNPTNYELKNYNLTIKKIEAESKYTHTMNFTADKVKNGLLTVKLKNTLPDWVTLANDEDGSNAVSGKTYGIKYQILGIYEAFTRQNQYYTELKINIK